MPLCHLVDQHTYRGIAHVLGAGAESTFAMRFQSLFNNCTGFNPRLADPETRLSRMPRCFSFVRSEVMLDRERRRASSRGPRCKGPASHSSAASMRPRRSQRLCFRSSLMAPGSTWSSTLASSLQLSALCLRRSKASAGTATFWSCWGCGVLKMRSPVGCSLGCRFPVEPMV